MGFFFNVYYWCITIPILLLMLFYLPVFTSIMLGVVLVIGIIGGVLLWKHRNK
jgi:hypothetical protein